MQSNSYIYLSENTIWFKESLAKNFTYNCIKVCGFCQLDVEVDVIRYAMPAN